jgi:transposase-like protein
MARIKQSDTISDLHYALTQLQCNKCGSTLKWRSNFSDINQPRYLSSHCNQDFIMSIASVRIKAQQSDKTKNDNARTKHRTRELVLPSNSNVVKGNV